MIWTWLTSLGMNFSFLLVISGIGLLLISAIFGLVHIPTWIMIAANIVAHVFGWKRVGHAVERFELASCLTAIVFPTLGSLLLGIGLINMGLNVYRELFLHP